MGVTIKFKVGNNVSALDATPRGQSANTLVSEQGLHRKYRQVCYQLFGNAANNFFGNAA